MNRGMLYSRNDAAYTDINDIKNVKGRKDLYRISFGVITFQMRYDKNSIFTNRTLKLAYVIPNKAKFATSRTAVTIFLGLKDNNGILNTAYEAKTASISCKKPLPLLKISITLIMTDNMIITLFLKFFMIFPASDRLFGQKVILFH